MRKVKLVSVYVLLALLLSVGSGEVLSQEPPPQNGASVVENCKAATDFPATFSVTPISEWLRYEDRAYGVALEYPAEWKVETAIQQSDPFSDPSAIIKRQTFTGPEGLIDLDIWLSNGRDLSKWLEWYGETRSKLPTTHPNAMIGGQPAVVFVENGATVDMLAAFFSNGQYVYRLWFTVTHNERGLQAYWGMLDTFTLPGNAITTAYIPEDIKQCAQRAMKSSAIPGILVASCCGYYDYDNPFPCCENKGNCTWWVFYKYGYVPFRGDAGTWWDQVPDYPDWSRGGQPRRNPGENIAWWSGSSGHVAHVANYTGGSNISITEMMWCTICYRARTISVSTPSGYIYEKYPPQP